MGSDDIVHMPGVSQLGPWVLIAVLMVPKLLDWWQQMTGRKLESEASAHANDVQLEIEKIKGEFARQKDFQEDLIQECQRLRDECKSLRDHNYAQSVSIMERDAMIRQRDETIAKMQKEIDTMRSELDTLKAHVKAIEYDRDRLRVSCQPLPEEPHE